MDLLAVVIKNYHLFRKTPRDFYYISEMFFLILLKKNE